MRIWADKAIAEYIVIMMTGGYMAHTIETHRVKTFDFWAIFHTLFGLSLMLFGKYVPSPTLAVESSQRLLDLGFTEVDGMVTLCISPLGMTVLMLFLGIVYLWSAVDTYWPGLLGIFLLGLSDYGTMNQVLSQFMGNPMTVYIFFLMVFCGALVHSNISAYLARFLMTLPIVKGRPWVLTTMVLITCYLVGLVEQVGAMFLMWSTLYVLFESAGYKKGDKYVTLMMVGSIIMILLAFASDPIKAGSFYLISNLMNISASNPDLAVDLNPALFLVFGLSISAISLVCMLISMRFIFRVDVSKLKSVDPEVLNKNPLPPMDIYQKGMIVLFASLATWMLLPGLIPANSALAMFCKQNSLAGTLILCILMSFVSFKGKPISDITDHGKKFPWRVFTLISVALMMGNALMHKDTYVSLFMEYALRDMLEGLGYMPLIIIACTIAIVATNLCNSVASGLVFTPVLLALCNALHFNSAPLLVCFFFTTMIAAVTPAASPFAALLFANKQWVKSGEATAYTLYYSLVILGIISFIGVPLAILLF